MDYYHIGNSTRSHAVGVPTDLRNVLIYPSNKPAQLNMPKPILSPTFKVVASSIYPLAKFHLVLMPSRQFSSNEAHFWSSSSSIVKLFVRRGLFGHLRWQVRTPRFGLWLRFWGSTIVLGYLIYDSSSTMLSVIAALSKNDARRERQFLTYL